MVITKGGWTKGRYALFQSELFTDMHVPRERSEGSGDFCWSNKVPIGCILTRRDEISDLWIRSEENCHKWQRLGLGVYRRFSTPLSFLPCPLKDVVKNPPKRIVEIFFDQCFSFIKDQNKSNTVRFQDLAMLDFGQQENEPSQGTMIWKHTSYRTTGV